MMDQRTPEVVRVATCCCGSLRLTSRGEPVRISMCHCIACQRRTGAPFGAQSRFLRGQVEIEGESQRYVRQADSGNAVTYHFCPRCGSTVYWRLDAFPDLVAVALGAYGDPSFSPPTVSVWERTRHEWTRHTDERAMEHID